MRRFALGVVFLIALAGCSEKEAPAPQPAAERAGADPVAGKAIAERSCLRCHGPDGAGATPGIPHLASQTEAYLVQSIREYAEGKRVHAVLKDMTPQLGERDIRDVAAYYAGLPPVGRESPASANSPYERGKASAAACASCHGADGNSATAGTPSLAGQQPAYLIAAVNEYHRGDRSVPGSAAMLRSTDKIELESVALYYASQMPAQRPAPSIGDVAAGEAATLPCAGCHGLRGVSNDAATPTLAGQDPQYLTLALKAYGKSRRHQTMEQQLSKLGERDLLNIAAYYAVQKSRPAERGQDFIARQVEKCDRCHGEAAGAAAMPVPRLAGQDKDYLVMSLRAYRDDRRQSSAMHKMSLPFSEAAIDGIASHYASQPARK